MRRPMIEWSRAVAGAFVWVAFVQTAAGQNLAEFEKSVTEFTLGNGLRFVVVERHGAPVVICHTYANVGAVDEVKGITGVAHLLEHMAFKGTTTIGTKDFEAEAKVMTRMDEIDQAIRREERKGSRADEERLTGLRRQFTEAQQEANKLLVPDEFSQVLGRAGCIGLNAVTNYDSTTYRVRLPSNKLELWMLLESDRFLHPVLRGFYEEKNVVMEERRQRSESDPAGRLGEEFLAVAYKAHPYGEPAVGHMSDLQALTRAEARAFFDKYYGASNLMAAVAGDVDPRSVQELAQAYFGRLPYRPPPDPVNTVEPPQAAERRVTIMDSSQPILLIGYHKPAINHPDDVVFDVVADIVGRGRTARLYTTLVKEKKIAMHATCFHHVPGDRYPGLFVFYVIPAQNHTNAECEEAISAEIERFKRELVTAEELKKAKTHARAGLIYQLDSTSGLARQLVFYELATGDWRNLFRRPEQIAQVSPQDIQRVARTYFVRGNRTVGMIETGETQK